MIPFLTVKPKAIKLKVSPRFPAQLLSGLGITITKANGNYTPALDYSNLPQSVTLPSGAYVLAFNPALNAYVLVPPSVFSGAIAEAPADGSTYGRLNGGWNKALPLAG